MNKIMKLGVVVLALALLYVGVGYAAKTLYPQKHSDLVKKYAQMYNLPEHLVYAVIKTESNFDEKATSHKEAAGLMQITNTTGKWIAEKMELKGFQTEQLYDPETNIKMGCFYLNYLLKMYDGDKTCALAAYNAGYANVNSWLLSKEHSKDGKTLADIPFPETEKYVKQVLRNEEIYQFLYPQ